MKMRPGFSYAQTASYASPLNGPASVQGFDAEWRAFQGVLIEALECVIDHAVACVREDRDDVQALEHLRTLLRAHFAGIAAPVCMHEFLQALAILLGGFQVEPRRFHRHCETGECEPLAIASERLRYVADVAAAAAHAAARSQMSAEPSAQAAPGPQAVQPPKPRPRKRSPSRPSKEPTSQAA